MCATEGLEASDQMKSIGGGGGGGGAAKDAKKKLKIGVCGEHGGGEEPGDVYWLPRTVDRLDSLGFEPLTTNV